MRFIFYLFLIFTNILIGCKKSRFRNPIPPENSTSKENIEQFEPDIWQNYPSYSLTDLSASNIEISEHELKDVRYVMIKTPLMDIDFINIKICEKNSDKCAIKPSNRPYTFLTGLEPGNYEISVQTCIHAERAIDKKSGCSDWGPIKSYTQTLNTNSEFSYHLAKWESIADERYSLGYELFDRINHFENTATKCPSYDKEYVTRVRSFRLGGADIIGYELSKLDETNLEQELFLTGDDDLPKDFEIDKARDQANRLGEEVKTARNKDELQNLYKKHQTEVDILNHSDERFKMRDTFRIEAADLDSKLLPNLEEDANITRGLNTDRKNALEEIVSLRQKLSTALTDFGIPKEDKLIELKKLQDDIKRLQSLMTQENWNKWGGYTEKNWENSREYKLHKKLDEAQKRLAEVIPAYEQHLKYVELDTQLSKVKGDIKIFERKALTVLPSHQAFVKVTGDSLALNPERASRLSSALATGDFDALSKIAYFQAIQLDARELPGFAQGPFRQIVFDLNLGKGFMIDLDSNGKLNIIAGAIKPEAMKALPIQEGPGKSLIRFSSPDTSQPRNISFSLEEIRRLMEAMDPRIRDPFLELLKDPTKIRVAPFNPTPTTSSGALLPAPKSQPSIFVQALNQEQIAKFFREISVNPKIYGPHQLVYETTPPPSKKTPPKALLPPPDLGSNTKVTKLPEAKKVTPLSSSPESESVKSAKEFNWRGPALAIGIGALIAAGAGGIYYATQKDDEALFLQDDCYRSIYENFRSEANRIIKESVQLNQIERANHSIILEMLDLEL